MNLKRRLDQLENALSGELDTVELEDGSEVVMTPEKALRGVVAGLEISAGKKDREDVEPELKELSKVKEGQGKTLDLIKSTLQE